MGYGQGQVGYAKRHLLDQKKGPRRILAQVTASQWLNCSTESFKALLVALAYANLLHDLIEEGLKAVFITPSVTVRAKFCANFLQLL